MVSSVVLAQTYTHPSHSQVFAMNATITHAVTQSAWHHHDSCQCCCLPRGALTCKPPRAVAKLSMYATMRGASWRTREIGAGSGRTRIAPIPIERAFGALTTTCKPITLIAGPFVCLMRRILTGPWINGSHAVLCERCYSTCFCSENHIYYFGCRR